MPLKEAIAEKYGVTPDQVVPAQGTSMANFLAMATILNRGEEVLIEQPAYDPLLSVLSYLGMEIKRFSRRFEDGYQIDLDRMGALITPRTSLIVLTNPHNPSGVFIQHSILKKIGVLADRVGARVLVDEVYRDILFDDAPPSHVHLGPHFVATSSLTKTYGLSGLRCGWILCEPKLAERMRRLNDLFGAVGSMPSDKLAVAAFRHLHLLEARTRSIIEPNIELAHRFLREHEDPLACVIPPRSMVVFPKLKNHADSVDLHDRLRKSDTSIVPGKFFEASQHFRLGFAVRTADVAIGLQNLSDVLRTIG
jgi:aspartate/methionine/tyrosine aminotransferase